MLLCPLLCATLPTAGAAKGGCGHSLVARQRNQSSYSSSHNQSFKICIYMYFYCFYIIPIYPSYYNIFFVGPVARTSSNLLSFQVNRRNRAKWSHAILRWHTVSEIQSKLRNDNSGKVTDKWGALVVDYWGRALPGPGLRLESEEEEEESRWNVRKCELLSKKCKIIIIATKVLPRSDWCKRTRGRMSLYDSIRNGLKLEWHWCPICIFKKTFYVSCLCQRHCHV